MEHQSIPDVPLKKATAMPNHVYIATSLDGYIADRDGGLGWLMNIPNPGNSDFGFADFLSGIDAIVMGRNTFEMVASFPGDWPYPIKVFVYSNSLNAVPKRLEDNAEIVSGNPSEIVVSLNAKGFRNLYIDGGKTIQTFLSFDLIDEMEIAQIPVLLGDGAPLFGFLKAPMDFELVSSHIEGNLFVKSRYRRRRT